MTITGPLRGMLLAGTLGTLAACGPDAGFDWDLRNQHTGLNTAAAARQPVADRPQPDARGVISYPGYQVAVARRGDSARSVAGRLGIGAEQLASFNAIDPDVTLRAGEVLALPGRVAADAAPLHGPATGQVIGAAPIDVTTIASGAIDRAESTGTGTTPAPAATAPGPEPVRHRVVRGETAWSIARLYNVSTRSLAEWNGLGTDLALREGQFLLIPAAAGSPPPRGTELASAPGQGSPTPEPPSAAQPLPAETPPAAARPQPVPEAPAMGSQRTAASAAQFAMPAEGSIVRPYAKGRNDGIGIGAAAGSPVRAAADGTVAAITRDTDQVPIVVIRHADDLLTVYANVDGIRVARDARVTRGQTIGTVRAGDPAFVHFEVRKGFESVDPMPYLQ
ncbi:MAG: peptidoglycan DD-metalloendopeptidase family protein [Gemmobacter sp.]